jgi:hypothetical protein
MNKLEQEIYYLELSIERQKTTIEDLRHLLHYGSNGIKIGDKYRVTKHAKGFLDKDEYPEAHKNKIYTLATFKSIKNFTGKHNLISECGAEFAPEWLEFVKE